MQVTSYIHAVYQSCEAPKIQKRTPEMSLSATLWSLYHMLSVALLATSALWEQTLAITLPNTRQSQRMVRLTRIA